MSKWNLVLAAMAALLTAGHAGAQSGEPVVVSIAHVGPLSGAQREFGRDNENGARLAINDLNKQGLTLAGRPLRFELLGLDDASDRPRATAVAKVICASSAVAVVGHLNAATSMAAAPTYAECGLARITPSATHPALTQPGNAGSFRLVASDDQLPPAVAIYARSTLKTTNVIAISDGTNYGNASVEAFDKAARLADMRVTRLLLDRSPANSAAEIAKRRPDAVFYAGVDEDAGPLLRELRRRSVRIPLLGSDGVCTAALAELSGGAADERVVCVEGGRPLADMPGGQEWKRRYDAEYPDQFRVYSLSTYDAVMLIAKAVQRAGSLERAAITAAIKETDHAGLTARIRFDSYGDMIDPPVTFHTFVKGRKQLIGTRAGLSVR